MSIGTRIKMRREELGMTQPELACLIGVSKGSIGNYESGISRPNEDILIKLFSALNCDANYLYFDDINKSEEILDSGEKNIIKKYRVLDEHGKDMVDTVLDKEYSRCAEETSRIKAYTANMAAGTGSEGLTEKKIKEMEAFGKLVSEYENKSE